MKEMAYKKVHQKIEIVFKFMKNPAQIDRTSKKNYKRIPCKFDQVSFYKAILGIYLKGNPLYFFEFILQGNPLYFFSKEFPVKFYKEILCIFVGSICREILCIFFQKNSL